MWLQYELGKEEGNSIFELIEVEGNGIFIDVIFWVVIIKYLKSRMQYNFFSVNIGLERVGYSFKVLEVLRDLVKDKCCVSYYYCFFYYVMFFV